MDQNKWNYKNFNMVVELDIAGEFIYNGISEFNRMAFINGDAPTFVSLYNISVGIERLQKIILVLWKLDDSSDEKEFENSLITHSHSLLRDEIIKYTKNSKYATFNERENDFITLIQKFYNTARYNRFNIDGENDIEVALFREYLSKYTDVTNSWFSQDCIIMTDKIKELLGRVIGSISHKYYQLIYEGSSRNSTFTYELRSGSKAQKVFLPDYRKKSLMEGQFNERISFKEILIYIRNSKDNSAFLKFIDEIEPLEFDPPLVIDYLKELSEGIISQDLMDQVETLYVENNYSIERIQLVDLIGNSNVSFEYPDIEECNNILLKILSEKNVNDDIIDSLNQHAKYIQDDEILKSIGEVDVAYKQYKERVYDINVFLKKIEKIHEEYQCFLINETLNESGDDIF